MALQVWLPLISDLRQQGIADTSTITLASGNAFVNGGKVGNKALHLTKQQTVLGTSSCMSGKKQMSYAFWVKVNTAWSAQWLDGIAWYSTDGSGAAYSRQEFYTNCTRIGTWFSGSSLSGYVFTPGEWTHIAGTFDYTTGIAKFYINGVLQGTSTSLSKTHYCRGDFYIGDSGVDIVENDVRIYDHALSPMEVKELSKGLVLHYPLNRGGWGQENLYGYGSDLQTTLSGLNNYNNSFSIIEEEGKKCAHVSGALTTTKYLQSKLTYTPSTMEQFTFSAEVKIKNIVRGTTNPMCEFYFSGATIDSAWRGFAVDYIHVDGVKVGATAIGFDRYLTDTAWHKVAVTAHFNYNGTSIIPALYPNIYLRDCTGDLYIRNVKLEKGPVATPWCPNSSDALATTMGLNGTTEYDTSGYCNNGTWHGTHTNTSDTSKYAVSTTATGSASTYLEGPILPAEAQTAALWIKCKKSQNAAIFNDKTTGLQIGLLNSILYMNSKTSTAGFTTTHWKDDDWNHVVVTYDGTTRKAYINGEAETQSGASNYYIHNADNCWLWNRSYNNNYPFNGSLSDFRIYTTALSPTDVKSLYQNCATIDPDGTIRGQIRS